MRVSSLVAAILAAWVGFGYWSLVVMTVVGSATNLGMVWKISSWRPGPPVRQTGVRVLLKYGINLAGSSVAEVVSNAVDKVVIGQAIGATTLGFYDRAYQLPTLPINQLTLSLRGVIVPVLSRLQDEPTRYRRMFLQVMGLFGMVTSLSMVILIITADWVVSILLGPQWHETARILSILGFAVLIQPFSATVTWLFMTQGRTDELLRWSIIGAVVRIFLVLVGIFWGVTGIALALTVSAAFRFFLFAWSAGKLGPVARVAIHKVALQVAIPTALALGVGYWLRGVLGEDPIIGMPVVVLCIMLTYVMQSALTVEGRALLASGLRLVRQLMAQRAPTA
jgi:PST family polysaccharide transporter